MTSGREGAELRGLWAWIWGLGGLDETMGLRWSIEGYSASNQDGDGDSSVSSTRCCAARRVIDQT